MSYPSINAYQDALQSPRLVFTDPELKSATVAKSALGLPVLRCGGFALTYSVQAGSKRYAVRCFHKQALDLERRYRLIADHLKKLASPYFLPFEFQPQGIRVDGASFPIVKMAWAEGETLGDFLDREHQRPAVLSTLRESLQRLASFLESHHLAHGDVQPGNVMVSDGGRTVRLIDYDGMFVDSLRGQAANELGQANFQHPQRAPQHFDERLDRFSFLALDVALQSLGHVKDLWRQTNSDPDGIVFRRSDYQSPGSSKTFGMLEGNAVVGQAVRDLAAVAASSFSATPSLAEFLGRRNIPQIVVAFGASASGGPTAYHGAFAVLDARDFDGCLACVGDKIELVGRIVEVSKNRTKHGAPYLFINFAPWKGRAVKLNVWSEGLKQLRAVPDNAWIGRWISVTGLMEPPYSNKKHGYTHLAITIHQANQMHHISEAEASFRHGARSRPTTSAPAPRNADVIQRMGGKTAAPPSPPRTAPAAPLRSANQQVLANMRKSAPQSPQPQPTIGPARPAAPPPTRSAPTADPSLLSRAMKWLRKTLS